MDEERLRELAAELGVDEDELRELVADMSKSDYDLYREWSVEQALRLGDPLKVPEFERALDRITEAADELRLAVERIADALQDDDDLASLRAEAERRWVEFQEALARVERIQGGRAELKP